MGGVLLINGQNIDLGNSNIIFSKACYSFEDWITKDIPYSERVVLPESPILNQIFFRPFASEIQGKKFSKFHTFKYYDNGTIVFSGICKMLGFSENREYELQLIDSSFQLFDGLKGKLTELDFESDDFIFGSAAYSTLKLPTSSSWIWAASSMHEDKILSKNILSGELAFSRPFFWAKRLIDKMLAANGWLYSLGLNCDLFDKLIISPKNKFVFTSYEKTFSGIITASNLNLQSPTFVNGDTISNPTILTLANKSKIRLRGTIDAPNDFVLILNATGAKPIVQNFYGNSGAQDYDLTSNDIEAGALVSVGLSGTGNFIFSNFLIYTIIDENDFGTMSSANFDGYKVKTYDNLPNLTQKDLFKHMLVSIAGFFNSNNFQKKLAIDSISTISKLSSLDWSGKFVQDSEAISPLNGYAKINYYAYDNSSKNPENLGRGVFSIDDETLEETTEVYRSIFAASQEVEITNPMVDNTVYNDTERINEINPLLAYYEEISGYTVARFNDLNGKNILLNYYANFLQAIQKNEIIEAKFKLNKSDYFLFDFKKTIYLEQKKSTYYVLSLGNYTEKELTDVKLLKY